MKQQDFEQKNASTWDAFADYLQATKPDKEYDFPEQYRLICHHYALAKQRQYSNYLVDKLNTLALNGHHRLYGRASTERNHWLSFFLHTFPASIRSNSGFVLIATLLFVLPGLISGLACYFGEDFVYSLMHPDEIRMMEAMYDPSGDMAGEAREADTDLMMFGHYINNNIGIAFRTFASGITFCIGSIFFLVFNGLMIGGVAGHLTQLSYTDTFYPFVIGHGSFELTGIVLSGAAGLKLGFSLFSPGQRTRLDALKNAAKEAGIIMAGVAFMLLIAAFIEAFWSSKTELGNTVRYIVGTLLWALVFAYFYFLGRTRESE